MQYPEDRSCPVVSSYIKALKAGIDPDDFVYEGLLDSLAYTPLHEKTNRSTEMFRAFYCLEAMQRLVLGKLGNGPSGGCPETEYTWVGLTRYIEYLSELDKTYTVQKVLTAFEVKRAPTQSKPPVILLNKRMVEAEIRVGLVTAAAEYLRPKLRNGASVGHMGFFLAKGLLHVSAPVHEIKNCLEEMLNIQRAPKDWCSPWGVGDIVDVK